MKNELQTLDGHPWTLLEAMDGQMNMSMIAILRKLLMRSNSNETPDDEERRLKYEI